MHAFKQRARPLDAAGQPIHGSSARAEMLILLQVIFNQGLVPVDAQNQNLKRVFFLQQLHSSCHRVQITVTLSLW